MEVMGVSVMQEPIPHLQYPGHHLYDFLLQTLLAGVLPSYNRLMRFVRLRQQPLREVGFTPSRFLEAVHFFRGHGYEGPFTLSSDATALVRAVTWRQSDDAILGLKVSDELLPSTDIRAGSSLAQLRSAVATHGLASQVEVLLLNAVDPRLPSFVLAVFAQGKGSLSELVVSRRWKTAERYLRQVGLEVVSRGSDGDPSQLAAMRSLQSVTSGGSEVPARALTFSSVPTLGDGLVLVSAAARRVEMLGTQVTLPFLNFQDFCHIGVKLRNKITRHRLLMGNDKWVTLDGLRSAMDDQRLAIELSLGLRRDDLDPRDRMNFKAFERLVSPRVFQYLDTVIQQEHDHVRPPLPDGGSSEHTRAFLRVARSAVFAFLDPALEPLERLRQAWYAAYFVKGWRQHLETKKKLAHFLTPNVYECICLNAESLLLFMHFLMQNPALRALPFAPWILGSQQNERLFRDVRQCGTYENFTLSEFLRRVTLQQMHQRTVCERAGVFSWPAHKKQQTVDQSHRVAPPIPPTLSEDDLRQTLHRVPSPPLLLLFILSRLAY